MIHETVSYTVAPGAVPACREAAQELVEHVRENEPDVLHYTVLEDAGEEYVHFLHLSSFRTPEARARHHDSEALRLFTDLVYPATRDGIRFTERRVVDRVVPEATRPRR